MKKWLLFVIPGVILIPLLAVHAAHSLPSRHFGMGMSHDFLEYRLDRLSRQLNLNQAQNAKLEELKSQIETAMDQRADKRLETRKDLSDQMSAKDFNVDAVTEILHKRIDERARLRHEIVDRIGQFCKELTPEQRKIVAERVLDRLEDEQ